MLSYDSRLGGMAPPTPPNAADHLPIATLRPNSASANQPAVKQDGTRHNAKHPHIWLITGPAGCGKSTVAQFIAKSMDLPYIEGDEFHPAANVEKMAQNIPLTDADRWDWLIQLREEAMKCLDHGSQGVVVTCSALKRKYRDVIRVAPYYARDVRLHFVYLHADEEVLLKRVSARQGHYMGPGMVQSQLGILEVPSSDETDVTCVDVSGSIEEVKQDALGKIESLIQQELLGDS